MIYSLTLEMIDGEIIVPSDGHKTNFAYLVNRAKESIQNRFIKTVEILDEYGESKLTIENK